MSVQSEPIRVLQDVLQILDDGRTESTYKFAVLLGLIDACMTGAGPDGTGRTVVTTRELAERVTAIYWPHTRPFEGRVLAQNGTRQANIITEIERARAKHNLTSLMSARTSGHWQALVSEVEWTLIEMPLPRLQYVNHEQVETLYHINWALKPRVRRKETRSADFDNRILLRPGVAEALVSLSAVLRPFIQQKWSEKVSKLNKLHEHKLGDFLFGCERSSLDPVRDVLATNQDSRCFYCDGPLSNQFDIDHFLPWSRHPSNDLANLVAADKTCNQKKSDFLPAVDHIAKWRERPTALLQSEAAKLSWTFTPEVELASARALYKPLTKDVRLWRGREVFEAVDLGRLAGVLG